MYGNALERVFHHWIVEEIESQSVLAFYTYKKKYLHKYKFIAELF